MLPIVLLLIVSQFNKRILFDMFLILVAITDIVFLAFCMPLLVVQYTLEQW
jgi:hypothetical protein